MTTILVWFLVTVGNHRTVHYSPPMATLEECLRLQNSKPVNWANSSQCVQLRIIK